MISYETSSYDSYRKVKGYYKVRHFHPSVDIKAIIPFSRFLMHLIVSLITTLDRAYPYIIYSSPLSFPFGSLRALFIHYPQGLYLLIHHFILRLGFLWTLR